MRGRSIFCFTASALALVACQTTDGTRAPNEANAPATRIAANDPDAADGIIQARPMPSAPLDQSRWPQRIVFASCLQQNEDQSIWNTIAAADPDLVLYIGDNVYGDVRSRDPALPELKAAYMRLAQSVPFARVRANAPLLPMWDDHDYGLNDAGGEFQFKEKAEELFHYVWATPKDDPRRARPGVYGSWYFEGESGAAEDRLQLIMVDTRYFRSELMETDERGAKGKERYLPDPDPSKTMLGEAQWAWLAEELKAPAKKRLLVSSIQVLADGHGWEAWKMLPAEREKLYAMIRAAGIDDITILTGDRHSGAFYKKDVGGLMVEEVTSSSLNLPSARWRTEEDTYMEPGPNRIGDMIFEANFGLMELTSQGDYVITLRGPDGAPYTP
ncbi:MAG: alkaline phosphatase D family protein [Pseudomonadota bacterium]